MKLKKILLSFVLILTFTACQNTELKKSSKVIKEEIKEDTGEKLAASIYFNSRDEKYKAPYGAVKERTKIKFNLQTEKGSAEDVVLVIEREKIRGEQESTEYLPVAKIKMRKYLKGDKDYWEAEYEFKEIGVYGYYFDLSKEDAKAIYHNNNNDPRVDYAVIKGTGGVGEGISRKNRKFRKIRRYRQTIYSKDYKTPDWIKGAVFYALYPDRFKNADRSNDPVVGKRKFHGNSDIESDIEFHDDWMSRPYMPGTVDKNDEDD